MVLNNQVWAAKVMGINMRTETRSSICYCVKEFFLFADNCVLLLRLSLFLVLLQFLLLLLVFFVREHQGIQVHSVDIELVGFLEQSSLRDLPQLELGIRPEIFMDVLHHLFVRFHYYLI